MPKSVEKRRTIIMDADGLVLGRLASTVAKQLLSGDSVVVVNAEKAVVSGERASILENAHSRLEIRTLGAKSKSPKHSRKPEGMMRRTIRGMLPRDKEKGREAFSRLRVYVGVPEEIDSSSVVKPPEAENRSIVRLTTLGEIAQSIGWKPVGE